MMERDEIQTDAMKEYSTCWPSFSACMSLVSPFMSYQALLRLKTILKLLARFLLKRWSLRLRP